VTSNQYPTDGVEPIAIVAMGSIFPGRGDTTGFWRDIVEGVDTFTSVPRTHWLIDDYHDSNLSAPDRTYGSRGAFIPATSFDPLTFGIPPNSLSTTDTAQLLALIVARNVLDDIERETACPLDKSRASVILGVAATTELVGQMMGRLQRPAWVKGMREAGLDEGQVQDIADRISSNFVEWKETTFPGLLGNVVAGRIANRLDFGGSNYVTDAACASSLSAMQIALHELHAGDSDLVLTGGVDALNDIFMYMCFSKTPALSPSGDCRPLSADADGTMLGEGVGMLALRRLSDAERDGNNIHAIIKGLGGGSDGRSTAVYAPLASGQERTLTRAYQKAGYSADTVELVEAHGTGTVAGDRTEIEALHSVFDPRSEANAPWCALGSVKSQIGHTKAAAGAAGLLKVIGGLSRKILPPTIKVRQPAKALCQNTPFYLGTQARPWIRGSSHPRRASVSSFGFGGSNFHVTLEEYTGKHAVQPVRVMPSELFLVSASTATDLCKHMEAYANDVAHEDDLARIASTSWTRFDNTHAHRAAIVADSPQHLKKLCVKLGALTRRDNQSAMPSDRHIHYGVGEVVAGKLALLFAGQGSQYPGMGADIAMGFSQARAVWDSACDMPATAGLKLHELAFPPTRFTEEAQNAANARLTNMRHAQPAIAAVALSQLALLRQLNVRADMQAGHSFGEVMALHSAGMFDAPTALTIARERSEAMSKAASTTSGSMLAVQSSATTVQDVLAGNFEGLTLANDNAPAQVVLSGDAVQLAQAASVLADRGIATHTLPVAAAFHSPQVDAAIQPFAQTLSRHRLAPGSTPVYANSTASVYPAEPSSVIKLLSEQIGKPVLFKQSLEAMHAAGATMFLEVGPGSVLSNLVRKTLPESDVTAIALDDKHGNGTTAFLCAVGQLAVSGIAVDMASLYEGLPAPTERQAPGKHSVNILGSNYQKPYPPQDKQANAASPVNNATAVDQTTQAHRMDAIAIGSDNSPSIQGIHQKNTSQTMNTESVMTQTSHQTPAVAKSTMAMKNQPSASNGATPPSKPHSNATMSYANGAAMDSPVQQAPASSSVRRTLFNDVSTRHAEYLAAISAAHQSYLRLASGFINDVEDTSYAELEEQAVLTNHSAITPDSVTMSAPVVRQESHNGAYTNGSCELPQETPAATPTSPTLTEALPAETPVDVPQSINGNSANGNSANGHGQGHGQGHDNNGASQQRISTDLVRSLIAEKTGYPVEMIEDDMDLSGELGIDSIKQVEVLSALRTQVPEIKDVGTADMGQLRTIRQIADFFG